MFTSASFSTTILCGIPDRNPSTAMVLVLCCVEDVPPTARGCLSKAKAGVVGTNGQSIKLIFYEQKTII